MMNYDMILYVIVLYACMRKACPKCMFAWDGMLHVMIYSDRCVMLTHLLSHAVFLMTPFPYLPFATFFAFLPLSLNSFFLNTHGRGRAAGLPVLRYFPLHSLCFVRSEDGFVDLVLPDSAERQLNLLLMIAKLCASRACVMYIFFFRFFFLYFLLFVTRRTLV